MSVYIEAVFVINCVVDYLLLVTSAAVCAVSVSRKRVLLAAMLGAVYSVFSYLPALYFLNGILGKLASGFSLCAITFGRKRKCYALFFLLGAAFSGMLLLLEKDTQNRSPWNVVLILVFCAIFRVMMAVLFRRCVSVQGKTIPVTVKLSGQIVETTALCDTGNTLKDPEGKQVLILSAEAFPSEIRRQLQRADSAMDMGAVLQKHIKGAEIIELPYATIDSAGFIPAVQSESVTLDRVNIPGIYVAVTRRKFAGSYQALWGEWEGERHGQNQKNPGLFEKPYLPTGGLLHRGK